MEDNNITHNTFDEGDDFFLIDKWHRKHHFKILSFEVPSGLFSEAIEVLDSESDTEPRIFHLLSTSLATFLLWLGLKDKSVDVNNYQVVTSYDRRKN